MLHMTLFSVIIKGVTSIKSDWIIIRYKYIFIHEFSTKMYDTCLWALVNKSLPIPSTNKQTAEFASILWN